MDFVSIYHNFENRGGAQNVTIQIASNISESKIVLTNTPLKKIDENYVGSNVIFKKFGIHEIIRNRNKIFLSHSRKLTTTLCLLNKLGLGLKIVHVAHNLFNDHKKTTLYPPIIIAVSNAVKQNLVDFFGISPDRITVIYNGDKDKYDIHRIEQNDGRTKLLIPARICPVKKQLDLVRAIKNRVPDDVLFCFAGKGEDLSKLLIEIKNDSHFRYDGLIDMKKDLYNYDYVCLFSEKEGMPLSLLEGCMFGKPLLTNAIAACLEINKDGWNGKVVCDFDELIRMLPNIPRPGSEEYIKYSVNSRKLYEIYFTENIMLNKYRNILNI